MSDFSNIKDATGFAEAAKQIIAQGQAAAKAHDQQKMQDASDDLLAFLQQRTSDCPPEVTHAVAAAQQELLQAIDSDSVAEIDAATTQLSALLIDVQRVTEDLQHKAKLITLQPVIDTLNSVTKLINDAKAIQAKIQGQDPTKIDIPDLQGDVKDVIDQLTSIAGNLKGLTS